MEVTPQETPEDSGFHTGTFDNSSSNNYDYSSTNTPYVETPTIPSGFSRKRKITHRISTQTLYSFETQSSNINYQPSDFLSSTLNESLSKSLEKCVIGNTPTSCFEFTPIELDSERSLKRHKFDNSPDYQPKTRSAPTTPTKQLESNNLSSPYKSESEHFDYRLFDTKKNYKKYTKLGSPERLELLYPNLKPVHTPLKLRTPEKLREFIKKINSPAKKRLFDNKDGQRKVIGKLDYCDPILVFLIKNDFRHIVSRIFSYLSATDLLAVSRVCKSWKRALIADFEAFPRYYAFSQTYKVNKENVTPVPVIPKKNSPDRNDQDYFEKFRKVAAQLTPDQSLQKCPQCMQLSVIEKSISQCQNPNCQYIYCIKCLCFSISGPENFVDRCQTSKLIINEPKSKNHLGHLNDISNTDILPTFLVNESLDRFQTKHDSSGYLSESDFSPVVKGNLSLTMDVKRFPVLQELNRNTQYSTTSKKNRRSSLCSVISSNNTPKADVMEPSSPPKVKAVVCSKQSKKNLKRLQF